MVNFLLIIIIVSSVGFNHYLALNQEKATCTATGDPHYKTFDDKRYDFMGICKYILAKDAGNNFEVLAKNKFCDSNRASCSHSITVTVKKLKIQYEKGGKVTVFGVPVKLPYRNRGVNIVQSEGLPVKITSDVGLEVSYDGVYDIWVTVYGQYKGKTRGLCGNYNGNPNDDFLKKDHVLTTDANEFANSWKVDRSCPNAPPPPNPCLQAEAHAQEAKKQCSLLKGQPFAQCHNSVKQEDGFIQNCEYDVCSCKDNPAACVCEEFLDYVTTCALVGVTIKWKHLPAFKQCAMPCASDPCPNGGKCSNLGNFNFQCKCLPGTSGKRCENGKPSSPCSSSPCLNGAKCIDRGTGYVCQCPNGYSGTWCEKEAIGTCSATGDPHYRTFDGKKYNFMGECHYVLARDTSNQFSVVGKNQRCEGRMSCTIAVTVTVKGLRINVAKGNDPVTVFDLPVKLPYKHRGVEIIQLGRSIKIVTDIGLMVQYDRVYNVFVTVFGRHKQKTLGLCGNFNSNPNDDFMKQDMTLTGNANEFADSWKTGRTCSNPPPLPHPCENASGVALTAKKKCSLLKGNPFSKCHGHVNSAAYIPDCEYDVCVCNKHPVSCLCEEIAAYGMDCGYAGVQLPDWRKLDSLKECTLPCASGPCSYGGACQNVGKTDYKCICLPGYTGKQCETRTCNNPKALGMESVKIPDSRIKASSEWNTNHGANNGRLNFQGGGGRTSAWSARINNDQQWIQADFKYKATVTDILTQGRAKDNQWVKSYTVSYSNDGINFKPYRSNSHTKVFKANKDKNTIVRQHISPVIVARYIRIHPKTWNGHISMRMEFKGCFEGQPCAEEPCPNSGECRHVGIGFQCYCLAGYSGDRCQQKECKYPLSLGMENGEVLDSQIASSSSWNSNHGPANARLNFKPIGHRQGAWSARHNNLLQWLQVDFVQHATVTDILTQGRQNYNQWVTSYTVSYTTDGIYFRDYEVDEKIKVFSGNRDRNSVVKHSLSPVIVTRYIRIHPKSWYGHISMRAEFYGCIKEWPCNTQPCVNGGTCIEYRGDYVCRCSNGYGGKNCEVDIEKFKKVKF